MRLYDIKTPNKLSLEKRAVHSKNNSQRSLWWYTHSFSRDVLSDNRRVLSTWLTDKLMLLVLPFKCLLRSYTYTTHVRDHRSVLKHLTMWSQQQTYLWQQRQSIFRLIWSLLTVNRYKLVADVSGKIDPETAALYWLLMWRSCFYHQNIQLLITQDPQSSW